MLLHLLYHKLEYRVFKYPLIYTAGLRQFHQGLFKLYSIKKSCLHYIPLNEMPGPTGMVSASLPDKSFHRLQQSSFA